jgi:hypothetical protein
MDKKGHTKRAFDVDDVFAGFYLAMCIRYNMPIIPRDIWDGKNECKFIARNFHYVATDYDFWANLPVIFKPEDINFDFDCYMSSFPPEMEKARLEWLEKNGFPDKPLICSTDKLESCRELGIDVLVDDRKTTIDSLEGTEVKGVWYRPWYMVEQGQHLDDLRELDNHLSL